MNKKQIIHLLSLAVLGILSIAIRVPGSYAPHNLTFDEPLYVSLALQMREGLFSYNTHNFLSQCTGPLDPPDYLDNPLFKHPPLYPATIALTYKIVELFQPAMKPYFHASYNQQTYTSTNLIYRYGVIPSLFWGLLCILYTYLTAKKCGSPSTGLIAACILTIEPVFWICSQKIWIDTMLACLLTIFAYYFILLIEDTRYWIHAGIALGLACITKYPAFIALALPVAGLFLFPQRRKYIFSALFIAFLIFLPWGYRIASVYGTAAFSEEHCEEIAKIMVLAKKWFFPCATGFAGLIFLLKFRNRFCKFIRAKYIRLIVVSCLICICLYSAYCRQHILAFLNPFHIPRNGDTARFFYYDPWYFYILRIIELAPVHLFFYCTLFTGYLFRCKPEVILLSVYALLYLAAMMIWQNPQCRYILPCIPLITVVDALCIQRIGTLTSKKVKAGLIIASAYVLFKTVWVGWNIAVPNNACYF